MNDQQRCIKLAEAMGLEKRNESVEGIYPDCDGPNLPFYSYSWFSPLTDANHDYMVLEWMRAIEAEGLDRELKHMDFNANLPEAYDYQIGDYARAALKVLEDKE